MCRCIKEGINRIATGALVTVIAVAAVVIAFAASEDARTKVTEAYKGVASTYEKVANETKNGSFADFAVNAVCLVYGQELISKQIQERLDAMNVTESGRHMQMLNGLRELREQLAIAKGDIVAEVRTAGGLIENATAKAANLTLQAVADLQTSKQSRGFLVFFAMPILLCLADGSVRTMVAVWNTFYIAATWLEFQQYVTVTMCFLVVCVCRVAWQPVDVLGALALCWARLKIHAYGPPTAIVAVPAGAAPGPILCPAQAAPQPAEADEVFEPQPTAPTAPTAFPPAYEAIANVTADDLVVGLGFDAGSSDDDEADDDAFEAETAAPAAAPAPAPMRLPARTPTRARSRAAASSSRYTIPGGASVLF